MCVQAHVCFAFVCRLEGDLTCFSSGVVDGVHLGFSDRVSH